MTINLHLPVFEVDRVRELAEGDEEFISDLLLGFLDDLQEKLDTIRRTSLQEADQIKLLCHAMKGACRNVGAVRLADLFFQLESTPELGHELFPQFELVVFETATSIKATLRP